MYESGYGVERDYEEAVKWYRLAAEQGNSRGQCALGKMYELGKGVKRNKKEALKWYCLAAEQWDKYAKERVKKLKIWPW